MDQFLKTNKQLFESDQEVSSVVSDMRKKRILRVKKNFLPFWMRKFPKDAEGMERKTVR